MTHSPLAPQLRPRRRVNTTLPEAAPGEAGRPRASTVRWALGSSVGCSSWSSEAGSIRRIASVAVDQALLGQVDRDLQRGLGGALAGAGLQHVELVAAGP